MSFICIEYVSSSGNTPVIEMMVSSVRDAFITGNILDNSSSVVAWRIKGLQGGLKYNYGWAPEEEWYKYRQVFYPESAAILVDKKACVNKSSRSVEKTESSYDPHAR